MQMRFLWIGKTKNCAIKSLVSDYLERIRHFVPCEVAELRDVSKRSSLPVDGLIEAEGNEILRRIPAGGRLVVLDETGSQFSSREFARRLETEQNHGARLITFAIGGPEGLSRMVLDKSNLILSLGRMTWTHEMCRVLLLEQIYRALCIMRNIPYHRGGE